MPPEMNEPEAPDDQPAEEHAKRSAKNDRRRIRKMTDALQTHGPWAIILAAFIGGMFTYWAAKGQVEVNEQSVVVQNYQRVVNDLREQLDRAEAENEQRVTALQAQVNDLTAQIQTMKQERRGWQTQQYEWMTTRIEMQSTIERLQAENANLSTQVATLTQQVATLTAQMNSATGS